MTKRSIPVKWENDPDNPWFIYEDHAYSLSDKDGFTSSITGTFTCDRIAAFCLSISLGKNSYNLDHARIYVDEELYNDYNPYDNDEKNITGFVDVGTHTIRIEHCTSRLDSYTKNATLRNIDLHTDWVDINMEEPGSLGRLILIDDLVQKLQDVELLKVNGAMNDDDWNTATQLTNLVVADFENAKFLSVPGNAYQNHTKLLDVILPEGTEEISERAFYNSTLQAIKIPSTLTTVGEYAFYRSAIRGVALPENLTSIGGYAFKYCTSLKSIYMGNRLESIPYDCFYDAKALSDVKLSSSLKMIDSQAFYGTKALEYLSLPESLEEIVSNAFVSSGLKEVHLPRKLSSIGYQSFAYCDSLHTVTLHAKARNLDETFYGCRNLKTIYSPVATPPTIKSTPLYDRVQITLIVPDFAYEDYKLDSYWYRCGVIKSSDEVSLNDSWSLVGSLNLDTDRRIRNTPDLTYLTGSSLHIAGTTPQAFDEVEYNTNETAPAIHLSDCDAITANSLLSALYMDANKWYFFTPVSDVRVADITHSATESFVIRYYDGEARASQNQTSGNWKNVTDEYLQRGKGYIVQANKAGWLHMPVEKENHQQFFGAGELSIPLTEAPCETTANANWNYVGNAYPTYFDIYYIDVDAPITVWTGSTYRALSLLDDNYALRPMQGYFVQKPSSDTEALMHKTGRQLSTSINHGSAAVAARRAPEKGRLRFDIAISAATDTVEVDMTRVVLNDRATTAYDANRDAAKFMSLDTTVPQICTVDGEGTPLSINERPYADGNVLMAVSVPDTKTQYFIHAIRAEGGVYLHDALTGMEHDLTESDYWFTPRQSGTDSSRFTLRFLPAQTGIDDAEASETAVFGQRGAILVKAPADAEVSIYASDGRLVRAFRGSETVSGLQGGVYVAKVGTEAFKVLVK